LPLYDVFDDLADRYDSWVYQHKAASLSEVEAYKKRHQCLIKIQRERCHLQIIKMISFLKKYTLNNAKASQVLDSST
jgi:hypothetical protein